MVSFIIQAEVCTHFQDTDHMLYKTLENFTADPSGRYSSSKDSDNFYPGDKILKGNYFDGWNDWGVRKYYKKVN